MNDKDVNRFIETVDTNNDGVITFDEWRNFFLLLPRKSTMSNIYHFHEKFVQCDLGESAHIPEGPSIFS